MQLNKKVIRPITRQLVSATAATLLLSERQMRDTWITEASAREGRQVREVLPLMQVNYSFPAGRGVKGCR